MKQEYIYKATILKVVDADTMDMRVDLGFGISVDKRFRVTDFDAPETYRPRNEAEKKHGKEATNRARELLLIGSNVIIKSGRDQGKYGRYLAKILLDDGEDFATLMIREGFSKRESYEGE